MNTTTANTARLLVSLKREGLLPTAVYDTLVDALADASMRYTLEADETPFSPLLPGLRARALLADELYYSVLDADKEA